MKCLLLIVFLGLMGLCVAEKPEMKTYGFIKGDMYYADNGVKSWGQNAINCASSATGTDTASVSFTAQHSRFGLTGSKISGSMEMGAQMELDFFAVASDANTKPRMRLAYAWCKPVSGLDVRIGQQWDLFSPLNPATNNTNANMWYNGNYGFRRAQFQARYQMTSYPLKPGIQVSIGEGAKETSGLGQDNVSGLPLIQGRLGVEFIEKKTVGLSALYGSLGINGEIKTSGFSIDADIPVHPLFAFKGEFAAGTNLNNVDLFTTAGSGTGSLDQKTNGFWLNAVSKPLNWMHLVLGAGMENVTTDNLADGLIKSNRAIYGDVVFLLAEHFVLTLEIENINTDIKGVGANTSNVIDISGQVSF
jgi:hypothetical protein